MKQRGDGERQSHIRLDECLTELLVGNKTFVQCQQDAPQEAHLFALALLTATMRQSPHMSSQAVNRLDKRLRQHFDQGRAARQ